MPKMEQHHNLSRRETQIMDLLYAEGHLTVNAIRERLPDPPTPMAIRTMLRILGDKGLLKRCKRGRGYIYSPKQSRERTANAALQRLIDTFFSGSVEKTIAACLAVKAGSLTPEERRRLVGLIEKSGAAGDAAEKSGSLSGDELEVHLL